MISQLGQLSLSSFEVDKWVVSCKRMYATSLGWSHMVNACGVKAEWFIPLWVADKTQKLCDPFNTCHSWAHWRWLRRCAIYKSTFTLLFTNYFTYTIRSLQPPHASMSAWTRGWLMLDSHLTHSRSQTTPNKDVFLHICFLPYTLLLCYKLPSKNNMLAVPNVLRVWPAQASGKDKQKSVQQSGRLFADDGALGLTVS